MIRPSNAIATIHMRKCIQVDEDESIEIDLLAWSAGLHHFMLCKHQLLEKD